MTNPQEAQEVGGAAATRQPAGALRAEPVPVSGKAAHQAQDDVLLALHQYRADMLYPPAPDSRERRIAMIDALLARIEGVPSLHEAAERALNYITNTESELGIQLECGDMLRAALAARGELSS